MKLKIIIPPDDEINEYDIFLGDIFLLNYCSINVFFRVCKTYKKSICLYELKKKKYKKEGIEYDMLTDRLLANKEPLVIKREVNSITKSNYEVYPTILPYSNEIVVPIEIDAFCPLYKEALKNENEYPITGTAYAYKVKTHINTCWEKGKKEKNKEKKYLKN